MKRWIVAVALALVCTGCFAPPAGPPAAPALDRAAAARLAMAADGALRSAMAGAAEADLTRFFREAALVALRSQADRLAQRGVRVEEMNVVSRLLFFDPHALEGVLAVESQHRLVTPDEAAVAWAAAFREWWVRFAFAAGAWWIVDQQDLPPDRWLAAS
jgi:hypothetical protein